MLEAWTLRTTLARKWRISRWFRAIYRIISENEADADEPIKLVEVNPRTMATGTFDAFGFAATPDVPYRTLIAEVTPQEFAEFRSAGRFPRGWDMASAKQYARPAARQS